MVQTRSALIRVGFVLGDLSDGWLGGLNYFRNLFTALDLLPARRIQPVAFIGTNAARPTSSFGNVDFVATDYLNRATLPGLLWNGLSALFGHSHFASRGMLNALLAQQKIDVLSHFVATKSDAIKAIGWIPDFQHVHLPGFFSRRELRVRNRDYLSIARDCDRVIVSSAAAQEDLRHFAPAAVAKSAVLHFVPEVESTYLDIGMADLETKYKFRAPYFFLPGQFWAHKNHRVVVDALAELKLRGISTTVVASGKGHDYRNPAHFTDLMERVRAAGLADSFRHVGVVPYRELLALMRYSRAVINASLFEGWSSTVEEAKVLGKQLILSDIPVHREQCPSGALFFAPSSSGELARALESIVKDPTPRQWTEPGPEYASARKRFAEQYQEIVVSVVH